METIKILKNYRKKAKRIAVLKSMLSGIFVGFCVDFILAFILLFCNVGVLETFLGSMIPAVILGLGAGFLFYFFKFSPSAKKVASMVDDLGLEERIVTMLECENDSSDIAILQRKDANEKLNKVNPNMFRFRIPVAMLVSLITVCILGVSMTTVSALTTFNYDKPGQSSGMVDPDDPSTLPEKEIEYVELYYYAGEGGYLTGETHQRIEKGSDATPVVAVAAEGFVFDQWDDGVMTSERWDWSVVKDLNVTAIFVKSAAGESGDGEQSGEGEGQGQGEGKGESEGEGEDDQGEPGGEQGGEQGEGHDGQSQGGEQSGEQGEGEGQGGGENQGSNPGKEENEGGGGGGAGWGGPTDDNSVIDGSTDYKEAADWEAQKQEVENDDSLPPELRDALSGYFDGMKP